MGIQRVGHIVIKMRDLGGAKRFYCDLLGMSVATESETSLFMRFEDYHHDLAVFKVSDEAPLPQKDQVGLAHIALVADSFDSVVAMYRKLKDNGVTVDFTTDHGFTKSLYTHDPEGNQIEIYCEVPEYDWRRDGFGGKMTRLDLDTPAAALAQAAP